MDDETRQSLLDYPDLPAAPSSYWDVLPLEIKVSLAFFFSFFKPLILWFTKKGFFFSLFRRLAFYPSIPSTPHPSNIVGSCVVSLSTSFPSIPPHLTPVYSTSGKVPFSIIALGGRGTGAVSCRRACSEFPYLIWLSYDPFQDGEDTILSPATATGFAWWPFVAKTTPPHTLLSLRLWC